MRKIVKILLTLLFLTLVQNASAIVVHGQVQDEKGNVLPGVTVTISKANRTITNIDGNFELMAEDDDLVTFTFVGFQRKTIKADGMPHIIKLSEAVYALQGVTVTTCDEELLRITKKMKSDYKKHGKHSAHFFNRLSIKDANGYTEMIETFLKARNVGLIEDVKLCSGNFWQTSMDGEETLFYLEHTDIDKLFTLSPFCTGRNYWLQVVAPLDEANTSRSLRRWYNISRETIDEGEQTILRYKVKRSNTKMDKIIDGTLYVDAATLAVEKFEGVLHGMPLTISFTDRGDEVFLTEIKFSINFRTDNGFSEIDYMSIESVNDLFTINSVMLNIEDCNLPWGKEYLPGNNFIATVKRIGDNPALSGRFSLIQRTEMDESLVEKMKNKESENLNFQIQ